MVRESVVGRFRKRVIGAIGAALARRAAGRLGVWAFNAPVLRSGVS